MKTLKPIAIVALLAAFAAGVYLHHAPGASGSAGMLAVVVENSAQRTLQIGAVLTDPDLLAYVAQAKIGWRVIDQTETGPDLAEVQFALDAAKNCPWSPALVIRKGAGKAAVMALPSTAAACTAMLQRYAG